MDLVNIVDDYNRQLRALKEEMSTRFQGELKTAFKTVFEKHPNVRCLTWTQYTPYFNDGDPCVFSVHDLEVYDETIEEDEDEGYTEGVYVGWGEGSARYPDIAEMARCLGNADDLLLEMFGDHCRITVTPDGISVEEYDHD
jgi:hypothetical protein